MLLLLFLAAVDIGFGADRTFLLETQSSAPYTPAYLGNGEIGVPTSPIGAAATECFASGVYDHAPGDVVRLAALPAWNEVDVFNGASWLNRATADQFGAHAYKQTLDMYDGVLRTEYEWKDGNRAALIRVDMFVSRVDPNMAAARVEVTPRFDGSITVLLPRTWRPYLRPPFQVLPETSSNDNINFITGAGAFLQQFLYGYSGLRLRPQGFAYAYQPLLPSSVRRLVLRNVTVRGKRQTITIRDGAVE
ncbi:MAG TPA: hypothetical protein VG675_00080 [Bryobacteraceae bacterium]|nr:hypothetical protein [Bryobacteraceae bacterium]